MLKHLVWMFLLLSIGTDCSHKIHHDSKGRVKMGEANHLCDDGKTDLERDINCTDFICTSTTIKAVLTPFAKHKCHKHKYEMEHKCMNEAIHYNVPIPSSGAHRPLWPKYGEYFYVPPQRWLHSVEHGAAVFLYHPCLDQGQVNALKDIAKNVEAKGRHLHKYIITPYNLPRDMPIAVVTYRCVLEMNAVLEEQMRHFVSKTALRGPESVHKDGWAKLNFNGTHNENFMDSTPIGKPCPTRVIYLEWISKHPPNDSSTPIYEQKCQCKVFNLRASLVNTNHNFISKFYATIWMEVLMEGVQSSNIAGQHKS